MNFTTDIKIILFTMFLGISAVLAEEGIQKNGPDEEEVVVIEKKDRDVGIHRGFGSSTIRDWYVLDSRNIVIEANGLEKYKATFMNACTGIRFTDSIGLATMGPFELDKSTRIILPDGQRCYIKELVPYTAEMEKQDRAKIRSEKEQKTGKAGPTDEKGESEN